jgi:hypothetical protein
MVVDQIDIQRGGFPLMRKIIFSKNLSGLPAD